jgi:hypothetical protein
MNADTITDFLATDLDGAFAFACRLIDAGEPPSSRFLEELRHILSTFSHADFEEEGTADWAHLVAGLMIGEHWDSDGLAAVAAPFLACKGTAVWTAAHNLLLSVSRLDQATFDVIATYAQSCPHKCDDLLAHLRGRIAG